LKDILTNLKNQIDKYRIIKFDKKTSNNQNFTYLMNDTINLILCITDNSSDSYIIDIMNYGFIEDLNYLYSYSENPIKEKIDNFFKIIFCLNKNLFLTKLEYFNYILESNRFFDLLVQSYFPQLNNSHLKVHLTEKISNFIEDLTSQEDFDENIIFDYPKIFKFLSVLKENCSLFSANIKNWKKDKAFVIDK
jgi:hypothetical protein